MHRARREDIRMLATAALIGVWACVIIQGSCFGIDTEAAGRPQPRTPRAAYCGPIDHWYRWIIFPTAALLVTSVTSLLLVRVPYRRTISLGVVLVLAIANFFVVDSLDYYVAI